MTGSRRVGPGFYALLLLIAAATFVVHEGAHWLAGVALGHEMTVTLNSSAPVGAVPREHDLMIAAAGPLVTLAGGLIAFVLILTRDSLTAYGVLFFALFMRFMAAVISLINPNDEARISLALGLGLYALPLIMVGVLLILTVIASRRLRLGWKTNLMTYLVSTVAVTAIVAADQFVVARG
ncbi:hypothetical protein [Brevundimonas sp.]|jgi:hypothetical protein|uniref:hypothetical protein n=1 Tax=Brevundimonas sp. TaxID=1871086 RepID=UPI00179186C1|nr:hypothetical protein [Brevundimonas sp.]MBA4806569.1 hypothetical protein [Brevundimonas sp.]